MNDPSPQLHQQAPAEVSLSAIRKTALSSSFGSALEYYDFALFSLAAALVFKPLYFNFPKWGIVFTMATYALGFVVRPLGGIIFGYIGDRVGRKTVLVSTITLMGLSTACIGIIPTSQQIGLWAPALLIFLRILNGLGAGADQAGAAILMTELSPKSKRGFYASLPFMGIQIGTVAASLLFHFLFNNYSAEVVVSGGYWRIPFVGSLLILVVALYLRLTMKESPVFEKAQISKKEPLSLSQLLVTSKRTLLRGIGLRLAENGGSSIYQVLALSFIVEQVHTSKDTGALSLVLAAIVGACIVPIAGTLTDKFGRVKVYRAFAIMQFITALPAWWLFTLNNHIITFMTLSFVLGCATWGMFGAQGAFIPEMFGSRARYTGVSVAREASAVIAGGIAPLVGSLIIHYTGQMTGHPILAWVPIALYLMILGAFTIYTTFQIPEVAQRDLSDPRDAIDAPDSLIKI
ncbi:MFS transporter [Entomobacter blattae]|uniref:Proline/betaine transporter n=1 Tax=Entomobacter blattae TaxID=2762277 RepID=A0A7H1NUA5_9PROT|nr:MFS transporter [Entomobacter blattae]QNT79365.1 Proline/betaine transporter [Entomobacter blattae]